VKEGIEVGVDAINAPQEQRDLLREVGHVERLLNELHDCLKRSQSVNGIQGLKDPLFELRQMIQHVGDKLQSTDKAGSKVLKAVNWALRNKREIQEDIGKMERFKSLLNAWLTMDIWLVPSQVQVVKANNNSGIHPKNCDRTMKVRCLTLVQCIY
jgi:chemotaxis regulatin CheY-phosphate phosphatase CheZ